MAPTDSTTLKTTKDLDLITSDSDLRTMSLSFEELLNKLTDEELLSQFEAVAKPFNRSFKLFNGEEVSSESEESVIDSDDDDTESEDEKSSNKSDEDVEMKDSETKRESKKSTKTQSEKKNLAKNSSKEVPSALVSKGVIKSNDKSVTVKKATALSESAEAKDTKSSNKENTTSGDSKEKLPKTDATTNSKSESDSSKKAAAADTQQQKPQSSESETTTVKTDNSSTDVDMTKSETTNETQPKLSESTDSSNCTKASTTTDPNESPSSSNNSKTVEPEGTAINKPWSLPPVPSKGILRRDIPAKTVNNKTNANLNNIVKRKIHFNRHKAIKTFTIKPKERKKLFWRPQQYTQFEFDYILSGPEEWENDPIYRQNCESVRQAKEAAFRQHLGVPRHVSLAKALGGLQFNR